MNESQLIDRALRGDSSAFGELVRAYQARLYNGITQVVGDRVAAEDVVQDAFMQAYLKLSTFHGNSSFYTWLYRIAINLAISWRRRQKGTISVDRQRDELGEEPTDDIAPPDDRVLKAEQAVQVQAALTLLSEEHRAILVLREVDGFSYEEIAEILDVQVGTVRSRLHRARLQLRDRLIERDPEFATREMSPE